MSDPIRELHRVASRVAWIGALAGIAAACYGLYRGFIFLVVLGIACLVLVPLLVMKLLAMQRMLDQHREEDGSQNG